MIMSLTTSELCDYVLNQLNTFIPDNRKVSLADLVEKSAFDDALERCEVCFNAMPKYRNSSWYFNERIPSDRKESAECFFYHLHSDQYATFLYFLSNNIYKLQGDRLICDKLMQLNKILHSCFIQYRCELPNVFNLAHPVGTILGLANYGEYFTVYQNVTVVSGEKAPPTLGKGVFLAAGSKIIGNPKIGDWVSIGANVLINDFDVPAEHIVYLANDGRVVMKKKQNPMKRTLTIYDPKYVANV